MIRRFILLPLLVAGLLHACSPGPDPARHITVDKMRGWITELSSDEMRGRQAFTPDAQRAADFIAAEFNEIGLEPLEGEDDFLQDFTVYTIERGERSLNFNGRKLAAGNFIVMGDYEDVQWEDLSQVEAAPIGRADPFTAAWEEYNDSGKDLVVLVHTDHEEDFRRYAGFYNRTRRTMRLNEGGTRLFILTDDTGIDSGSLTAGNEVSSRRGANVAGMIPGTERPDEYVLFSAHYDHLGVATPVEGDSIANGADDDASGTSAVIALADWYRALGPQERSLVFVAFTAEEIGGYGSRYFSEQMDPAQVAAMFNIEMIGKPSQFGPNTAFLTGFEASDMGAILQRNLEGTPYAIHPDPYPEQNLFYRSDNATLARLGVPAHTISSVQIDTDEYYHTVDDELETLNLEHMTNMIRAIALSSRSIVTGEDTPSRVDPEGLD
ncbi:MAG: M20/M25/M40 family metallo-hydrolase [Balneolaceae bacterium]|nr:M20/M25/M40 family metallo-hydrolase [Balneolaceae bacterium]